MSNIVLTEESSLFAVPYFAEMLDAELYVMLPAYNNFFQNGRQGIDWQGGSVVNGDNLFVVGAVALRGIAPKIEAGHYKTVAIILCGSAFCRDYVWVNDFIKHNRVTVYCMSDKVPYLQHDYIPAFQALKIKEGVIVEKKSKLTIGHSPSNPQKAIHKGTPQILKTIEKLHKSYYFDFLLIQNMTMDECLKAKSSCHIFIDQLIHGNPHVPQDYFGGQIRYEGGLGKSGLEAMLLNSCVITGGVPADTKGYFPPPPITWTNLGNFYEDLKDLIVQGDKRDALTREQNVWATQYCSYEFARKHFTQHIS